LSIAALGCVKRHARAAFEKNRIEAVLGHQSSSALDSSLSLVVSNRSLNNLTQALDKNPAE
jgi:hypothetical protein